MSVQTSQNGECRLRVVVTVFRFEEANFMRLPSRRKRQRVGRGGNQEALDDLLDLGESPSSSHSGRKRGKLSSSGGKTKKGI